MAPLMRQEGAQLAKRAVDIADGVDERHAHSGAVVQRSFTNEWEPRYQRAGWKLNIDSFVRGDAMRKFATALVAVLAIGASAVAMSTPAAAWRGWGWGWGWGPGPFFGGLAAGAIIAGAAASPYYYHGYYPYAAYGPYPYYGPECGRVWNGYYWVRACY
jgi:hypothetical protein